MKKFIKTLLVVLISAICFTGCTNKEYDIITKIRLEAFDKFTKRIEYRYTIEEMDIPISKKDYLKEKKKLEKKIPKMKNDNEFCAELDDLARKFKDYHLQFSYETYSAKKIIDGAFRRYGDEYILAYLPKGEKNDQLLYKTKLLKINDVPVEKVIKKITPLILCENKYGFEMESAGFLTGRTTLIKAGIISDDDIEVKYTLENIETKEKVDINFPISKSNSTEIERNNLAIPITFFYSDPSYNFYPMRTDRKYMSQEIDNDTYFIQLNGFYEDSNPNLQDFNQKVANDFEKNNYKKLIIDLRYNPGGYGSIFDDLFNTIIKNYNKNKFDVYTLIGAKSASASILNAYRIEELFPNNTFVGTPPCQKPNFNAPVLEYYDYKNILGIEMVYSYGCYICDPKNPDALYPDITIEETLDDWLNNYDRVLETVVSMPIDEEKLKTYPNANIDFSDFNKWGKEGSIKVIFDKEDMKKWIGE